MATHVPFLTVEDGDDLIVSFGLGEHAAESLTLLRTPKYESLLPDEERGVTVGRGSANSSERELLVAVHWGERLVQIESTAMQYVLDIHAVETEEVQVAKAVLRKMNFDKRFGLSDV